MDVIVKESKIEGSGVFAARDFKKGELVLDWRDVHAIEPNQIVSKDDQKFVYYEEGKRYLITAPARFVNHSCDPNTFIRNHCGFAKRDIACGEEITEDYSLENNPDFHLVCTCGSKNCKKIIKKRKCLQV